MFRELFTESLDDITVRDNKGKFYIQGKSAKVYLVNGDEKKS